MASRFAVIAEAIKSRLNAGTPVAASIERGRARPVPEQTLTAVRITLGNSTCERSSWGSGAADWTTAVELECYARAAGGASTNGEDAVDALLQAVHDRLLADPTLGLGAEQVGDLWVEGISWDTDNQATAIGLATLNVMVRHRTDNNSLT